MNVDAKIMIVEGKGLLNYSFVYFMLYNKSILKYLMS